MTAAGIRWARPLGRAGSYRGSYRGVGFDVWLYSNPAPGGASSWVVRIALDGGPTRTYQGGHGGLVTARETAREMVRDVVDVDLSR